MREWRKKLDPLVNERLSQLLRETSAFTDAIHASEDKSKAQILTALAVVYDKMIAIESRLDELQREKKIPDAELKKILKSIEKL